MSTPIINGSVGIDIPNPNSELSKFMASGVRNVMSNTILSKEMKYSSTIKSTSGIIAPHICVLTIKYELKAINSVLNR